VLSAEGFGMGTVVIGGGGGGSAGQTAEVRRGRSVRWGGGSREVDGEEKGGGWEGGGFVRGWRAVRAGGYGGGEGVGWGREWGGLEWW